MTGVFLSKNIPTQSDKKQKNMMRSLMSATNCDYIKYFEEHEADESSENQRRDLVSLKKLLIEALGENATIYWNLLSEFLVGKISKLVFDQKAIAYLGPNGILALILVTLHNQLIINILHNIQLDVVQGRSDFTSNLDLKDIPRKSEVVNRIDMRRKEYLKQAMELEPEDRIRVIEASKIPEQESFARPSIEDGLFLDSAAPPSSVENGDILSKEALKQRMQFILSMNELVNPIPNECVEIMQHALEVYIKTIISSVLVKFPDDSEIDLNQLELAFELNPSIVPATRVFQLDDTRESEPVEESLPQTRAPSPQFQDYSIYPHLSTLKKYLPVESPQKKRKKPSVERTATRKRRNSSRLST